MLRKGVKSFYEWCIENGKQEYLSLWDYALNIKTPQDIAATDNSKYYFKCEKGIHDSFKKRISNLVACGHLACPRCNSIYQWCLDNGRLDIIDAYDNKKNTIDFWNISKQSSKKYWFTFEHYSYYYPIAYITQSNKGDPVFKYKNSLGYYLIDNYGEDAIEKYWSDKNTKSPFEYDKGSGLEVWIKCVNKSYHDDYKTKCYVFTGSNCRCPMCASKIIHPQDSFAQFNIERYGKEWIDKNWCDDNTINPFTLSVHNNSTRVHIKCRKVEYHDFWITPHNYSLRDDVCCYCHAIGTNGKTHPLDSIGSKFPKINVLWSDKNHKTPFEYSPFSHETVYLKCENGIHEDYLRTLSDYALCPYRLCPKCSNTVSSFERLTREFLEQFPYTILHENYCTITPQNPKTGYYLYFDNEIVELKLIIEVMGIQHYELNGFHVLQAKHNNTTPEEEFEYIKWKDAYKKSYAISNGYAYLELPYTFFSTDKYKNVICNKITEIVNRNP